MDNIYTMPTLQYQGRCGVLREHQGRHFRPSPRRMRVTIPAREVLLAAGARVTEGEGELEWEVQLGDRVPADLVVVRIRDGLGLRLAIEPPYPMERPTLWEQADFLPCPRCAAPVVWYEAGYVPGYRICCGSRRHHVRIVSHPPAS